VPRRYERATQRLLRLLTALAFLALTLIGSPTFASGLSPTIEAALPAAARVSLQFHALAGQRCFSKADYAEAIRLRCGEDAKKAAEWKTCTEVRDDAQADAAECRGSLRVRELDVAGLTLKNDDLKQREAERWKPMTWFTIGAATVAAGVAAVAIVFR
jgi:hypothetical protein